MPELQELKQTQECNQQDDHSPPTVRHEQQHAPWKTISRDATDQQKQQRGDHLDRQIEAHRPGRMGQHQDLPGQHGGKGTIANNGDGLPSPEKGKRTGLEGARDRGRAQAP